MDLEKTLKKLKKASFELVKLSDQKIQEILEVLAKNLEKNLNIILKENQKDLARIDIKDSIYDRVLLNKERVFAMAQGVREIAKSPSPIGIILEHRKIEKGLDLTKITTPIGVVAVIFEARPNIVIDIFTLCLKSKNVCVLKGGSQSSHSNMILTKIIKESLGKFSNFMEILINDRTIVEKLLKADKYVDVIIPRGGENLINFVRENSKIPVIETGAGVVHSYFDEFGDIKKGAAIIFNAKTSRPSVCNALDTLIVNKKRLKDLPHLCSKLAEKNVEIYADKPAFDALSKNSKNFYPEELLFKAFEENFGKEYLSLKMSIKTVVNIEEAIEHINIHGSGHSEAIITENQKNAEKFLNEIDAAAVYLNASTRFTDGGVYGLTAEVGISTQKLHARGPMGIKELTTYKWIVRGNGQVR